MPIVLDIETVGRAVEDIPGRALEYLYRGLERDAPDPEELERRRGDLLSRLGLDPATGKVVCIGVIDVATSVERTFSHADERELLLSFWAWLDAARPTLFVSF